MSHRPVSELTYAEAEARRSKSRRQYKLRQMGRPSKVTPEEFAAARRLLLRARATGMDDQMINVQLGLKIGNTVVWKIRTGAAKGMLRSTYERIMTLRPEAVESSPHKTRTKIPDGAQVSAVGTQRRLQALRCDGFNNIVLAERLGVTSEAVSDMAVRPRAIVYYSTYREVKELYDALDGKTPSDLGVPVFAQKKARTFALRYGATPRHTWDRDTIDDPRAVPEWTGMCGELEGYRIHRREGIPVCPACREAWAGRRKDNVIPEYRFSGALFKELRLARGYSQKKLELASGLSTGQIHHWENGQSDPRATSLEKVLSVLDATFDDVRESEEA